MSTPARLAGIIFAPRTAYAEVARRPRWFVPLLLVCVIVAGVNFAFLSTRVGQTAYFNQSMDVLQSFGVTVTDAMYDRMEAQLQYAPYTTAAAQAVTFPIFSVILSGIFFAVFVAVLGAEGTFAQVFAVVVHSEMIVVVQQLFIVPLNYARHAMNSPTTLAAFVPMFDEHSYLVRLLGGLDLFAIWSMVNLSIGLGVLFKRRTGPIATTILVIYAVIVAIVAAIRS
jgi:hypothetical protein